ncbi:copper resistance CopC family protein [Cryobacterium roopkundense]|uniref:CopC domain-containing protein n=1 Tax=Cryobacterium roopkundense TaxID=1001240 RepID=A0A7W9A110_9MICO|nr:copper resistance CopC family protein [Cryobacterium roopkundense]MBB5643610.1 hypothetical protein [Cryobacterium roopkundense]
MHHTRLRHAHRAGAALATLIASLVLGVGVPAASAHDSVLSTTPGETEHLGSAPAQIEMVFTDDILQLGAILLVVDEGGDDWAQGAPTLEGAKVSQAVATDLPDGNYQVRWRVVSADGHPVSGTFDFGVGAADAVFTAESGAAASASAAPQNEDAPPTEAQPLTSSTPWHVPVALIGAGGAVIGVAIFSLILFLLRRQHAQTSTRASASSNTGTTHGTEPLT